MFTVSAGHRSVTTDTYETIEPRRAHRRYVAVDPDVVASRLASRGWETRVVHGRSRGHLRPRTAIVEAIGSNLPDNYREAAKVYLDHRGRSSILIQAGALRVLCRNDFQAPQFRLHHCSGAAGDFLARPWHWIERAVERARALPGRVESLRGRPGGLNLPLWLQSKAPRLGQLALQWFEGYSRMDGPSLWAGLQALTAVHSPRVDRLVGRTLADNTAYLDLLHGQVLRGAWLS